MKSHFFSILDCILFRQGYSTIACISQKILHVYVFKVSGPWVEIVFSAAVFKVQKSTLKLNLQEVIEVAQKSWTNQNIFMETEQTQSTDDDRVIWSKAPEQASKGTLRWDCFVSLTRAVRIYGQIPTKLCRIWYLKYDMMLFIHVMFNCISFKFYLPTLCSKWSFIVFSTLFSIVLIFLDKYQNHALKDLYYVHNWKV